MNREVRRRTNAVFVRPTRREFIASVAGTVVATALPRTGKAEEASAGFALRYILASAMYGYSSLEAILPEVKKTGASAIDIWPKAHGNQREQVEEMGHQRFAELLEGHGVRLGCSSCYKLGPFRLQDEMRFAEKIGGRGVVIVCGAPGPKSLQGAELKSAVGDFVEKMKPHTEVAEQTGCVIAIENHVDSLLESPDSIRWFGALVKSDHL